MLKLTNLCFTYADKGVIENLNFTFPEKGIVALMGPSGIGKTTLLKLLAGVLNPTGGEVTCTYRKTAMAFQESRLLKWFNSKENINFVLSENNFSPNTATEWLERFGLSAHENSLPTALSGGEQQRLSLARALAVGADLLLLDEPFSALDEALAKRAAALIKNTNSEGLTIIVTHDRTHAEWLGAQVLYLNGSPVTTLKNQP